MGIVVENVSLIIDKKSILKNINLNLAEGKIYGIIGRNGSGKTMLMKCLCGYVLPTEGKIKYPEGIIGKDIDFPNSLGVIIENPGFIPVYSGYNNLKYLASINNKIGRERIIETMNRLDLNPDEKKSVRKYSLGMRQRLGIAQAIMENPKTLILDEPFNGLDNEGVDQVRSILRSLKAEDRVILISSHIKEDIDVLCDEVFSMDKGQITKVTSRESLNKDSDLSISQVI